MRLAAVVSLVILASCGDDSSGDAGREDGGDDVAAEGDTHDDAAHAADAVADIARVDPGFIDPATLGLEEDPPGLWLRGDFHVHATGASNDTGGDSTPEAIKRVAMERGLFFVVLTDHSNSTGSDPTTRDEDPALFNMGPEFPYWDRAAALSEAGVFIMVDGNEVSPVAVGDPATDPSGHIGCIPTDLDTFDRSGVFVDRPRGEVSGTHVLDQALARSCFTIVNHPYALAPWIAFDWSMGGPTWEYDAIEVWNGTIGFAVDDQKGFDLWRCDLLDGRDVAGVGASDNHRVNTPVPGRSLDPALGYPSTEVFATEPTWEAIMAGVRAGRTLINEGGSRVQLDGYGQSGERADGDGVELTTFRIRATLDPVLSHARLRLTRANSCQDARPSNEPPVVDETLLLEYEVRAGETLDVAFLLSDVAPGVYIASLVTETAHFGAFSAPFVVSR